MEGINQIQVNNRAGLTFATGLRSILRNDPDIVMVGEIRDRETARIAIESALTGHLVLSTLHTNDAAGALTRLGDMGIEPYLTASSVVAVLAQRLVRLLCRHCREAYTLQRDELLAAVPDFPVADGENRVTLYRPAGCLRCSNTGYSGRKGVYELLIVSDAIRQLTLQRRSAGEIAGQAVSEGMVTLRQDGLQKVKQGITSIEEVLRVIV
jgi:type IV pilus assembly protein PilB